MSDKELIARLHLPRPKDADVDEVTLPIWVLALLAEAADHIEELEAKLKSALVALDDIGSGDSEWIDDPQKELDWCRNRANEALTKNQKRADMSDECIFCHRDPYPYEDIAFGFQAPTVTCCNLGVALYQHGDRELARVADRINEGEQALANMQREYDKRGDRIKGLEAKLKTVLSREAITIAKSIIS